MPETESMKQNKFELCRELMKQRMEIIRNKRLKAIQLLLNEMMGFT